MRIDDLKEAENVILAVTIQGENLEFKSVVIGHNKNSILIEPIRVNEKIINFSSSHVKLDLLWMRNDQPPVMWKLVHLSIAVRNKKACYAVECTSEGIQVNRRGAFRMFMGIGGVAQIGSNRKAGNVTIKDISESGFSFVCEDNLENFKNIPVRLVFNDEEDKFSLTGLLVRKEVVEEHKIVYGCILNTKSYMLGKYISRKQREKLSKHYSSISDKKAIAVSKMKESVDKDTKLNNKNISDEKRVINNIDKQERRKIFSK